VRLTENRITTEVGGAESSAGIHEKMHDKAFRGELPIEPLQTSGPDGRPIAVSQGMVHHWRGLVFIPGVSLAAVVEAARHPERHRQDDVLEARVLARADDTMQIYLRLRRSSVVTVVYNTEHRISFHSQAPGRVSSRSVATRIAELADAGTTREREMPPGQDSGYLWRLNAYWRYQEVKGGVLVECESLSLSRDVPGLLSGLVRPIVDRIARESLGRTLAALRDQFSAP
jgi:hypothetical protein